MFLQFKSSQLKPLGQKKLEMDCYLRRNNKFVSDSLVIHSNLESGVLIKKILCLIKMTIMSTFSIDLE